jgi:hypothetical protein
MVQGLQPENEGVVMIAQMYPLRDPHKEAGPWRSWRLGWAWFPSIQCVDPGPVGGRRCDLYAAPRQCAIVNCIASAADGD